MGIKIDAAVQACSTISREIRDSYKNLTIHFVVHHDGQMAETLALTSNEIASHPASSTAIHLLQNAADSEQSGFLGAAAAQQSYFFNLTRKDLLLALCSVNLEEFKNIKALRHFAYHMAWHGIDSYNFYMNPRNRRGDVSEVVIRKRNTLQMAQANLQADAFSAIISSLHGLPESVGKISLARSINALERGTQIDPEAFPFPIAMEITETMVKELGGKHRSPKRYVTQALQKARAIGIAFDKDAIKNWLTFAESAQNMAWRGYEKEDIISAAINTSENTYIRASGHLVAEITGVAPTSVIDIQEKYSPFADSAFNESLHKKLVLKIYEDIIAKGIAEGSASPFRELANRQNIELTEGKVAGWCAPTLQAAAGAYEDAVQKGEEPEAYIRTKIQGEQERVSWDTLKALGDKVVEQQKSGNMVTMTELKELCKDLTGSSVIAGSIETTKSDPKYKAQLENTQTNQLEPAAPAGPAPAASMVPRTPAAAAIPVPGLGGGGAARPQTQTQTHGATTSGVPDADAKKLRGSKEEAQQG